MTKSYRKYHDQLDDVLRALMETYKTSEPLEVIQANLKGNISLEQLELILGYLQTLIFCSRCEETYQIMFRGVLHLEEGGFKKIIKDQTHNTIWIVAKTISAAISTLAIIIIGIFQFKAADRANVDRELVKTLSSTVDSFKNETVKKDFIIKSLNEKLKDTIK